ncbi:MAG TPA: hypothetical protein VJ750_00255 [Rhizomicrobium sp.]|nr:hypothetical protein [Rhizomicrobium sp.]
MRARILSVIFLGFFALLTAMSSGPAAAQPYGRGPDRERDGVQPLDRLLPGIRRQHPGEFYDAEGPTYGPSGDARYHLKWMTPDGRIIWFDTDARSGRVLRSSPGRDAFDGHRYEGPPPSGGYGRPYVDRYPPYTADPYDRGYGRERDYRRGPGNGRPFREWDGRGRWRPR